MKFDCLFMELLLGGWLWELLYVFIYGASVEVIHRWTNIALLSIQDIAERLKKFKDETGKMHSGSESEDPAKDSWIYKVTPIRTMMNVKKKHILLCNLERAMNWLVIRFLFKSMNV